MKVYIARQGDYDDDLIIGVYDSRAGATAGLRRARVEWNAIRHNPGVEPYWRVEAHDVITKRPTAAALGKDQP